MFSATSCPNGDTDSAAFSGIGAGKDMSLQIKFTTAGGSNTVKILCSHDGTNYVVPETGGTIISAVTDELYHVCTISSPLCLFFKLRVSNTGTTCTASAIVLSQ